VWKAVRVGRKDDKARDPMRVGRLERVEPTLAWIETLEVIRKRNCESVADKAMRGGTRWGPNAGAGKTLEGMKAQESSGLRRGLKHGALQQRTRTWPEALESSRTRRPTAGGQGAPRGSPGLVWGESSGGRNPKGVTGMK
jgi:hypothetical protein